MERLIYKIIFIILGLTFSSFTLGAPEFHLQENIIHESNSVILENKFLPDIPGTAGMGSRFGYNISVYENTAVIGAPSASDTGIVYIYNYDDKHWVHTHTLRPDEGIFRDFGASVSIFGNKLLIGEARQSFDTFTDYVYVFEQINNKWIQQAKLVASDANLNESFGLNVSLYGDKALIGSEGKAYVFELLNKNWQETQILVPNAGSINNVPQDVSLYENRAVVGAYLDSDNGTFSGAAYVFELVNDNWSQTAKIKPNDGSVMDLFGQSISLYENRLLIGSRRDEGIIKKVSAYIFDFIDGKWVQSAKLLQDESISPSDFFISVSLVGNRALISANDNGSLGAAYVFDFKEGIWSQSINLNQFQNVNNYGRFSTLSQNRAFIGAWQDINANTEDNAVFIFDFSNENWNNSAIIDSGESSSFDLFGSSVKLLGDTVFISSPGDDENGLNNGSIYVYQLIKGLWMQTDKIFSDTDRINEYLGHGISYSENRMLVAANNVSRNDSGLAYVFELIDGAWEQNGRLVANDTFSEDEFGFSVSLSGNKAAVSASKQNGTVQGSGAVYIFDLIDGLWIQTAKLIALDGKSNDSFGVSINLLNDRILIGAPSDDDNGLSSGSAYVFDFDGKNWLQTAKIIPDDGESNDFFGVKVSLSNDRVFVSSPKDDDIQQDSGAVYIFELINEDWIQTAKLAPQGLMVNDGIDSLSSTNNSLAFRTLGGSEAETGAVYVYNFIDGFWEQTYKIIAKDSNTLDQFGYSISFSNDKLLVGARNDDDYGANSGSAYIFDLTPSDIIFFNGFELLSEE